MPSCSCFRGSHAAFLNRGLLTDIGDVAEDIVVLSKEAWARGKAAVSLTDHATDVNPFLILYVIYQDWD